jgi:hypothetical protein
MSETAGTVIKLLSALTSPKASIKYISVGVFLVVSWKYLDSTLTSLGAPKEQQSLIALLIGLGIGSLVGQIIYILIETIWNKIEFYFKAREENIKKEKIENEKLAIIQEKNEKLLVVFKKAFEHFPYFKKDVLRSMLEKEQRLEWNLEYVDSLKSNQYIIKTANIDSDTDLYTLNSAIQNYIEEQWKEETKLNMNDFFGEITPEKKELIEVMKYTEVEFQGAISKSCLHTMPPCLIKEAEDKAGFYISFRTPYYELFSEKLGVELNQEVYISNDWVKA